MFFIGLFLGIFIIGFGLTFFSSIGIEEMYEEEEDKE